VKAYSEAAQAAIDQANLIQYVEYNNYKIIIKYNMLDKFINLIYSINGEVLQRDFGEDILLKIRLPKGQEKNIKNFVDSNQLELNDV
jgi:putative IMPACT (imprinted ancient) family translation regulator